MIAWDKATVVSKEATNVLKVATIFSKETTAARKIEKKTWKEATTVMEKATTNSCEKGRTTLEKVLPKGKDSLEWNNNYIERSNSYFERSDNC